MKIKDLSIAELKAAYDFVLLDIEDLKAKAKKENVSVESLGAYPEVKKVENDLYNALINITRLLE